jgi:hypothetical protein
MASKPCKCGSTEHESVVSRGLAGMTTITSCPVEVAEAHRAMQEPVRMYSRVGLDGVKHYHDEEGWEKRYLADRDKAEAEYLEMDYTDLHIHYHLDMNQKGFSRITQHHLDKAKLKQMISMLNSYAHVNNMRDDKRFSREEVHKYVISDPRNSLWNEHYDIFENNKQLDMLLRTGRYQPYTKSPYIWRTIHLSDVERHAVQMIMLVNDMKDTYTMMITEGEEE